MSAYVITSSRAQPTPDNKDYYVKITGRKQGVVSWMLALLGVSPIVAIKVSGTRLEFTQGSLSGTVHRIIPLPGICSTIYGYHKPWKEALGLFVFLAWLVIGVVSAAVNPGPSRHGGDIGAGMGIVLAGVAVDMAVTALYFFLNRKLTLGFVENSGVISAIQFKRSVIENQDINEEQAGHVCELVQMAVEARQRSLSQPLA